MSDPSQVPNTTPATSSATTVTNDGDTLKTTGVKPGWKTSEFYLALAAKILSGMFAFGLVGDGSTISRLAGVAGFVLTQLGYTVSRTLIKTAAPMVLLCFALAHLTGCSGATRQRDLGYTLSGVVAASAALDTYEGPHELEIVKACLPDDKAGCEAKVKAFQDERDKARKTIKATLDLIGTAYKANSDASVTTAEAAAVQLYTFLKTIGVPL